ncbi:hypothetical protein AVKW3434_04315 [Acidovorax sp. SUPP3434]|uniref:hypothetical protein n=1 Tax=Acidovorax sp. SUPP3434 TaxID=2920880 RepID=UPI0023DE692A|nr:hypothetical protein [Acidovorax sp. SUPP3434]GKS98573.1 hypothetical protein AVKW3434_04315 [Acidovorax sp. SUPP3434]
MGLQLFHFVYDTLMQKANDNAPDNSLFLPVALSGMTDGSGNKYLPLKGNQWNLDNIGGAQDISADMATSWFQALFPLIGQLSLQTNPTPPVTQQMVDDAKAAVTYIMSQHLNVIPYPGVGPDLDVSSIEIQGLANIQVSGEPPAVTTSNAGYTAEITLNLNAYASTGQDWNQPLALAGPEKGTDSTTSPPTAFDGLGFTLKQCLCFVDKQMNIVAPPPTLGLTLSSDHANGFECLATGIALLTLSNAKVVSGTTVAVDGTGNSAALQIDLNTVQLVAVQGTTPTFTLQNLQYQSISPVPFPAYINTSVFYAPWSQFFKQVLSTGDAAQLLSTQVNNALMDSGNRTQVGKLLNQQLKNAFDDIFGSTQVAGSTVDTDANAVDKYLFDRARGALNDPSSYVYLPTLVLGSTSPVLEPYTAVNLSIPGPFKTPIMEQNIVLSDIVLQSLAVQGLSNVVAPPNNIVFGGDPTNPQASATLLLGTMNPGPTVTIKGTPRTVPSPPATASTPFTLNVQVNQNAPIPLSGTLNLSLQNNSNTLGIQTALNASGDTPDDLKLTYSKIVLVAGDQDVVLTVTLPDDESAYAMFINAFLSQSQLIEQVVSALNDAIADNLQQISDAATQFARSAFKNLGQ